MISVENIRNKMRSNEMTHSSLDSKTYTDILQAVVMEITADHEENPQKAHQCLNKILDHIDLDRNSGIYLLIKATPFIVIPYFVSVLYNNNLTALRNDKWCGLYLCLTIVAACVTALISYSLYMEWSFANVKTVLTQDEQDRFAVTLTMLATGWKARADDNKPSNETLAETQARLHKDAPQMRKLLVLQVLKAAVEIMSEIPNLTQTPAGFHFNTSAKAAEVALKRRGPPTPKPGEVRA